jgi:hypothetical protein
MLPKDPTKVEEYRRKLTAAKTGRKNPYITMARKGKKLDDIYGPEKAQIIKKKLSLAGKGKLHPYKKPRVSSWNKDKFGYHINVSTEKRRGGKTWEEIYPGRDVSAMKRKLGAARVDRILNGDLSFSHGRFGSFHSEKNRKQIHYRSSWELIEFRKAENDIDCYRYEVEPFRIQYYDSEGNLRYSVPDLLKYYKDGTRELREIKPQWKIDTNYQSTVQKLDAYEKYAAEHDMRFRIITGKDLF